MWKKALIAALVIVSAAATEAEAGFFRRGGCSGQGRAGILQRIANGERTPLLHRAGREAGGGAGGVCSP